jgi:DNA-3-methyladenine glycosylase
MKLPTEYYLNEDVLWLAKDLLGKVIYTNIGGEITGAIITETEAYAGISDKASHAYGGKRTNRTETMYMPGGVAYVYLCYGMYHLFNVVTGTKNMPHAVLIRAVYPYENDSLIFKRRKAKSFNKNLLNGPGKLTIALGITKNHDKTDLTGNIIWIEDKKITVPDNKIKITPRIGVDYAGEDAKLPYRFVIDDYSIFSAL